MGNPLSIVLFMGESSMEDVAKLRAWIAQLHQNLESALAALAVNSTAGSIQCRGQLMSISALGVVQKTRVRSMKPFGTSGNGLMECPNQKSPKFSIIHP